MYTNSIEIYFFEDDKTVGYTFCADTIEEAKDHNIDELIAEAGGQYSMMESEVVVSSVIEGPDGYADSDEYFRTYKPRKSRKCGELTLA